MTEQDLRLLLGFYKSLDFHELIVSNQGQNEGMPSMGEDEFIFHNTESIEGISYIKNSIGDCKLCKLHSTRKNIVFGEGSDRAEIMFIGEGPGADEDIQGRPFVGKAGQLLTNLIIKLGLTREAVYIANIVKCRPPENRDPEPDEISACIGFLKEQIRFINPKVIVALGKVATHSLLNIAEPLAKYSIMRERGRLKEYVDKDLKIPLMPTYHPSYLLRNRQAKWDVWEDMQIVMRKIKNE